MELPGGLELRFHPDEDHFPTWHTASDKERPNPPCFINEGEHNFHGKVFPCRGHQFYFAHNPAIGLGGIFPRSEALGYHRHDVEAVYVLYDTETGDPRHVYYQAHGLGQGSWWTWEECEKTEDGALVVYFAWGSHAAYPAPGDVVRILGFANDQVEDGGRKIRIGAENYVPAEDFDFGDGIRIRSHIPTISNTNISDKERALLPFVDDDIRERARNQPE